MQLLYVKKLQSYVHMITVFFLLISQKNNLQQKVRFSQKWSHILSISEAYMYMYMTSKISKSLPKISKHLVSLIQAYTHTYNVFVGIYIVHVYICIFPI